MGKSSDSVQQTIEQIEQIASTVDIACSAKRGKQPRTPTHLTQLHRHAQQHARSYAHCTHRQTHRQNKQTREHTRANMTQNHTLTNECSHKSNTSAHVNTYHSTNQATSNATKHIYRKVRHRTSRIKNTPTTMQTHRHNPKQSVHTHLKYCTARAHDVVKIYGNQVDLDTWSRN